MTTDNSSTYAPLSWWLQPDRIKEVSLLGIIAVSMIVFSFLIDGYPGGQFFDRLTTSVVIVAILAVAQSIVIISRNIDLSVGSIVGFAAYLTGDFLASFASAGPVIAISVAVLVGAILGSINGVLVAFAGVPAIIVTLGTLAVFRTAMGLYAGGVDITVDVLPDWVLEFNQISMLTVGEFSLTLIFVITIAVVLIAQWFLGRVRGGRMVYALGSNPDAARQTGLPSARLIFLSFVASGALAGLAGFMYLTRVGTISAGAGAGLELRSVAAAVVGGVSILGGSGTVVGAFLGALLLDTLRLSLIRVPAITEFWIEAALGILILAAVMLDASLRKRFNLRWAAAARRSAAEALHGPGSVAEGGRADA